MNLEVGMLFRYTEKYESFPNAVFSINTINSVNFHCTPVNDVAEKWYKITRGHNRVISYFNEDLKTGVIEMVMKREIKEI